MPASPQDRIRGATKLSLAVHLDEAAAILRRVLRGMPPWHGATGTTVCGLVAREARHSDRPYRPNGRDVHEGAAVQHRQPGGDGHGAGLHAGLRFARVA